MEKFSEYRNRMHRQGFVVPSSDRHAYKIPKEFRKFIGTLSDCALFDNFYKHESEQVHGKWVFWEEEHEPTFSVEELERIVEACGGSIVLITFLMREVRFYGIEKLRGMSTDDFEKEDGYGKKRLDALVAIGVKDNRVVKTRTPHGIKGWFSGTLDGVKVHGQICGEYLSSRDV